MIRSTLTLLAILAFGSLVAQPKLNFDSLLAANAYPFKGTTTFAGKGWDHIIAKSKRTNYVLIGEDHFISEVPLFTQAFAQEIRPDNYICEIDQWMLDIFRAKFSLPVTQLDAWVSANYNGFSFFQKKNEFELLRYLNSRKVNLIGAEQVGLMSTTILFQYLYETGSPGNKKWYQALRDSSDVVNKKFFADFSKPFFMGTAYFKDTMGKLDKSSMKPGERSLVDAMIRSAAIYSTQSHRDRVKLIQQDVLAHYPQTLKGKKNLFKYGANHTIKGESYLPVYDVGTTAHMLAQAENQDSYHILVLPKAGQQAGFLSGKNDIDMNEGIMAALKPLLEKASATDWTTFDLEAVRSAIRKSRYPITDKMLERTLFGYDALVVIPVATAAEPVR